MLSFDIVNLVCVVVNLIVLYILMKKFVFGRVFKILDARAQMLEEQRAEAGRMRDEAEALKKEYEENLANANETSRQIIQEAKEQAKEEYNKVIKRANHTADSMRASAMEAIEMEKEKQMDEMHAHVMDLAVETANRIMASWAETDGNNALYEAFLKEAGDAK